MKHYLPLLTIVLFICSIPGKAQLKLPAFGDVSAAELQMKECDFEQDAPAMFLINEERAEITFNESTGYSKIIYDRRVRLKIFKQSGFAYASISIPYSAKNKISKITEIDAYWYELDANNNVVKHHIDKKDILQDKAEGKNGMNALRFTFPGLKTGAVIEYAYTKIRKYASTPEPWLFQDLIPTRLSVCTVVAPLSTKINTHFVVNSAVEEDTITSKSVAKEMVLKRYYLHNLPSFKMEPLMSSIKDNLQRVEFAVNFRRGFFSSMVSDPKIAWNMYNMGLLYSANFGGQFTTNIKGTEKALDSIKKMPATTAKINAVFELVKKQVKWDKEQTLFAEDINESWASKSGNSAEINITLINLLKKVNVPCYPLLISTRENGKIDMNFPSLGQFNGVDVLVLDSTENYVLDATQEYINYTIPPMNIINRSCYIIDNTENRFVTIADIRPLISTTVNIEGTIDSTGVLHALAALSYKDYAKAERMEEEKEIDDKKKQEREKDFISLELADIIIDSTQKKNADNPAEPFLHQLYFHSALTNTGDLFFINPFTFSMFHKNPFTDSTRNSDIDFGSNQHFSNYLHFSMPDNFVLDELPRNKILRMADSSIVFTREIFKGNNELVVRNNFDLNNAIFAKEDYMAIKDFFEKIYSLFNEPLVLRKKVE
ncbi:DUF3857 domain-containing protein [Limnovirga soli]|uniref:DUF3857 domain-containing protein n=1 Tax=Limnovirga soli TaxID=2656915 RepID=A0A8J8JX76_9BACT|nr:DUF3857 domain-containing protein [Limnovirga soli]NNV56076.1 DUF3857 domain-containing protein [Limnovirga soli]